MKVTGFDLRDAIKMHELRRELPEKAFTGSLRRYEKDPVAETPVALAQAFEESEAALAALQTAQMTYNLQVKVSLNGQPLTLAEAIKRVGGMGRLQKLWKSALGEKADRLYIPESRDPSQEHMVSTISAKEAMAHALAASRKHSALQAAIGVANATEVDIQNLDPKLFE